MASENTGEGYRGMEPGVNCTPAHRRVSIPSVPKPMTGRGRERLPDRRNSYSQKFRIGGQTIHTTVGLYGDGRPGELWIDTAKAGAAFRTLASALSISVSLGLQYGVPLAEFVDAFIGLQVDPAGIVENHARIRYAPSFIDAIFRDLAIHFLNREDLAHSEAPAGRNEIAPEETGDQNRTAGRISQSIHS